MANSKHFLFVPAPEAGHLLPVIPVARRLQHAGHSVRFLTAHVFQPFLRRAGFEADVYAEGTPASPERTPIQAHIDGRTLWRQEWALQPEERTANRFLARLQQIALAHPVDLVVFDQVFHSKPECVASRLAQSHRIAFLATSLPRPGKPAFSTAAPTIILCPKDLLPSDAQPIPESTTFAEPSVDLDRPEAVPELVFSNPEAPLVLCSFGSQTSRHMEISNRLRMLCAVAEQQSHLNFAVASGSGTLRPATSVPPNVKHAESLPQLAMLRRAAAFITHAGLGSVKEAILFGVPMLCWPLGFDQDFNSDCVERLQLGLHAGTGDISADHLVAKLSHLIADGGIASHLSKMQAVFQDRQAKPIAHLVLQDLV